MLLQSHEWYNTEGEYTINVLPAVPARWASGRFEGRCARGGYEVSAEWAEHRVTEIRIKSLNGEWAVVKTDLTDVTGEDGSKVEARLGKGLIVFGTEPGKTYIIK